MQPQKVSLACTMESSLCQSFHPGVLREQPRVKVQTHWHAWGKGTAWVTALQHRSAITPQKRASAGAGGWSNPFISLSMSWES